MKDIVWQIAGGAKCTQIEGPRDGSSLTSLLDTLHALLKALGSHQISTFHRVVGVATMCVNVAEQEVPLGDPYAVPIMLGPSANPDAIASPVSLALRYRADS